MKNKFLKFQAQSQGRIYVSNSLSSDFSNEYEALSKIQLLQLLITQSSNNSSDKEIIAEALNTDFKSYKFKVKNSPGIEATRTWSGKYQNDPLKAQAKVDKTSMAK